MPTKPNKAGNQQNYVPAGNGDASGEYGDNATGSNVHIVIERKDDEEVVKPTSSSSATKSETSSNHKERVGTYIQNHSNFKKQVLSNITDTINNGDEQCNKLLADALEKGNYSYESGRSSYYRNSSKTVVMSQADMINRSRDKGEVFYHESGHLIDFQNKQPFGDTINQPLSCSFVSSKYNQTMQQTVKEEAREFARNRQLVTEEASQYKTEMENKYIKDAGITENELERYKQIRVDYDNAMREIYTKYQSQIDNQTRELYSERISYTQYKDQVTQLKNQRDAEQLKYAGQHSDTILKMQEYDVKIQDIKSKAHDEFIKKYSSLSDMLDAATGGYYTLGAGSHGRRYWKQDNQNQAVEFFAEIYSAKARKSNEEYDLIKKYFPKSVEIFEEILKG